jgi:DNA invertase Pin-like site-specific DNA recombinase
MAKVGYARTSTVEQEAGLEAQVRDLRAAGCDRIFEEHASAVKQRDKLEEALNYIREGDEFIVTKVDRLARSVSDFMNLHERIKAKGVSLKIINMGIDINTPTGELVLTMLAGFAQMERSMMLERQKEGIAKAKEEGRYAGRKPLPEEIKNQVMNYLETGVSKVWISKKLNIGEASVYRIAREWRKKPAK